MFPSDGLSAAEAAVFETFVVPRYLKLFGELALSMVLPTPGARVAHLGCRTGFPDVELCRIIEEPTVYGVDPSSFALELARNKASLARGVQIEYSVSDTLPAPFPSGAFSHVLCLHPVVKPDQRVPLFIEMARLLYGQGQALVALPLRGSFQEIGDLLREYALKYDEELLGQRVESLMIERPTIESLSEELEIAGLEDIDVEVRHTVLSFDSGRALVEDPVCRMLILPDLRAGLAGTDLTRPLEYLRDAVDRYWSEATFELTLSVGCASARRVA